MAEEPLEKKLDIRKIPWNQIEHNIQEWILTVFYAKFEKANIREILFSVAPCVNFEYKNGIPEKWWIGESDTAILINILKN